MSSDDLISAYIEAQGQQQAVDLMNDEITSIKAVAGDEQYTQLTHGQVITLTHPWLKPLIH